MGILFGTSGCLLVRPKAVHKLSELTIDTDKLWAAKGISSVKEVAEGMTKGDMVFSDGVRLTKITPGPIGTMLTAHDFGNDLTWSY
jgi:hypothetical protein